MRSNRVSALFAGVLAVSAAAAFAQTLSAGKAPAADNQRAPMVMLVPVGAHPVCAGVAVVDERPSDAQRLKQLLAP